MSGPILPLTKALRINDPPSYPQSNKPSFLDSISTFHKAFLLTAWTELTTNR